MSFKDIVRGYIEAAVTWKDATIILSRVRSNYHMVYYHEAGRWVRQTTSGDGPKLVYYTITATVVEDTFYVLGGSVMDQNSTLVYALDLNSWKLTRLTTGGCTFTLDNIHGCSSWAYKGDLYLLGVIVGLPDSLGIFCYNISNNHWKRIVTDGIPSPRYLTSTFIKDD